jgi:peptidoglycan/LPS O-acetylase OafA/YrhL
MIFHVTWIAFCIISASLVFGIKRIEIEKGRELNIDGLRYLLAAFVAFHHNDASFSYFKLGSWSKHGIELGYLGQFGVALFFMITGYLFGGIKKETSWVAFFIKRAFRIIPLTYLSSIICICIATYIGMTMGFKPDYKNIIYWFDGGISGLKGPIYGYKDTFLIPAGVTWTLYWEWAFYFSLPLLSFLFNKKHTVGICIAAISVIAHFASYLKIPNPNVSFLLFFAIGILVRNLKGISDIPLRIKNHLATAILIYCIFISSNHIAYNITSSIFIGVFFYLIANGADLYGLLRTRGFVILGDASYSIYLLHGIAWFSMNKIVFHYGIESHPIVYYIIQTVIWFGICGLSLLTYRYIEKPFISRGKKIAEKLKTPQMPN